MRPHKIPLWLAVVVVAVSLPLCLPFLYVAMRSWQVGAVRAAELLFRPRMWDLLGNTLMLMSGVTLISIVLGTACAVLFQRCRFFGKSFFQTAITLPLCIPAFVSCFTWISLTFKVEGFWGTVMIMSLSSFPLAYLPVEAALKKVSLSYEEVSLSLGKNRLQTFFLAILPQLKPAIGSSILLIALHMLVEFGAVSILNYPTFTTAIFQEYEMSFDNNTAALLSAVLLAICGIVVLAESFFRGKAKLYHSGKGAPRPYPVRTLGTTAQIGVCLFLTALLTLSIIIPFGVLIHWMIVGTSHDTLNDLTPVIEAFARSLGVSAAGALLTIICALPLVWASVRCRNLLTVWIERLPYLLHAVPGLVIALSLIYFSINYTPALYQTFAVVVLAYFMLYLPMAQTTLRSSLEQFPPDMEHIAGTLGRSPFFIFRTLVIPSILPGITAAFALVFLNLMKELTATLLLTPDDIHTLSTAVWEYTSDAQYAAATPYALMLVLFSGIPVFLLKKYAFK